MAETNPFHRFITLTDVIRNAHGDPEMQGRGAHREGFPIGALISFSMKRPLREELYTADEKMLDYIRLLQMGVEAREYLVAHMTPKALGINLSNLDNLLGTYAALNTDSSATVIRNFSHEVMVRLHLTNSHLEDNEVDVDKDHIEDVLAHLDALVEAIRTSNIDLSLKDRMMRTLGVLRLAITRVNIVGTEEIIGETEKFMGQLFRAEMTERANGKPDGTRNLVKQGVELADLIEKVVNLTQKVGPTLVLGYAAIQHMLPPPQ